MHHEAAALLQLEQVGEAVRVNFQADPDRIERAPHQLVEVAVALGRSGGITDDESLAVGQGPIAVRPPPVAELVEQGIGGPGIVRDAELVARIMASDAGRDRILGADRLSLANDLDLVADLVRPRNGAAPGGLLPARSAR